MLDIDSPGGEASGSFELARRVREAAAVKPVWAVANDMAFSAAYALASAASKVFVSRTGGVGSIGVIAMHVDQSERDLQDGVRYTAVFAGDRKNDLNPHEPISSEAHAFLKAEVNRIYGLFVETVARNRGIEPSTVRDTEAGLFFGQAAVALGLADAIGTFDDALAQLLESVSPLPNLETSKPSLTPGLARVSHSGLLRNLQMESSMNDQNHHSDLAAPDRPNADPGGSTPGTPQLAAATATAMAMAQAVEIAQTCALAGRTDLIAGFLESQASAAQVRSQLLAAQAEASPEIRSLISPDAPAPTASSPGLANPVIQAAKQLASQSLASKKEH